MSRARELAKAGGVQQRIAGFSSHVGMSTFLAAVHMEDNLTVDGNIGVGGNLTVTGTTTFNGGTLTLGDANTDNVVFGGEVDSHIVPDDDGTFDLGSSTKEWRNLYIDGTANIDALVADTADINGGTVDGATVGANSASSGAFTTLTASGDVDLGDATSDTITATGRFDSDIVPSTDNARDLGASGLEFKDLYLDGTANIDSLVADTADINGGTADNVVIGGSTAAAGSFTTVAASSNATITGNLDVDGATTLDGLTVAENAAFSANLDVDGATTLDGLTVAEAATFSNNVAVTGTLDVDGATTLDGLTVAEGASFSSTLGVTGTTTLAGQLDANGDVNLGNATTDSVTVTGRFDSDLLPIADGTSDLGSSTLEWQDLYIDGTANIDSLVADTADINGGTADNVVIGGSTAAAGSFTTVAASSNATITGNLDVDGDTTLDTTDVAGTLTVVGSAVVDNVTVNGNTVSTSSGNLTLDSTGGTVAINDTATVSGNFTVTGGTFINGSIDLGDATSDTITPTARFDAALVPATDNAIDLGTSTLEYKDLYLDGTANIDSLVADTADINGGTVDGATIGANSASTGAFTTISASGNVDFNGDLDVDGTTNLDVVDIDGAVDMASNLVIAGNIDANGNLDVDGTTDLDTTNVVGTLTVTGDIAADNVTVNGNTVSTSSGNLTLDSTGGTVAVADNLTVSGNGSVTGTFDVDGATTLDGLTVAEAAAFSAGVTITGALDANGGASIDNVQVGVSNDNEIDTSSGNLVIDSAGGTTTVDDNLVISGNLTVNGTTNTVNSTTVTIADKNFQVATGAADDAAADGGGLTVDSGDGDKTWNFEATGDNWGSNQNINAASGKAYKINNTSVLNATTLGGAVVNSSLTSVGTIASGVWQGTAIANGYLANSSVSYGGVSLSLGGSDGTPAFDLSDATNYPTSSLSGTITNAQLAGSIANSKLSTISTANKVSISALNIDGGTDIGADIVNADEIIIDDGGGGTNRRSDMTRVKKYIWSSASGDATASDSGAITLAASGVSAGTVGSSSAIPILTIDAKGRITSTSTSSIDSTAISQGNSSMTVSDSGTGSIVAAIDGSTLATFAAAGITLSSGAFVGNVTGNVTGNTSGSSGSCTGNAATATILANARTIAGVSFNGSANISLNNNAITNGAGYITSSGTSAACSGNAATATLATNVTATANNGTNENVFPTFVDSSAGGSQGIETDSGLSYNPSTNALTTTTFIGALTGNASGSSGSCTGNAATATILANARTIAGVSFNGSANISLNNNAITNGAGYITSSGTSAACSGNAATATLASSSTISANNSNNETVYPVFVDGATGTQGLESDTGFSYNPSSNTLTAGTFSGALSGNATTATSATNADTVDSLHASSFVRSDTSDTMSGTLTMSGNIVPNANGTRNLGASGTRWANVYSSDLDLSNEAKGANKVDGTWGSYLIEEGEDNLYLTNRRNGKSYRFVLEEV